MNLYQNILETSFIFLFPFALVKPENVQLAVNDSANFEGQKTYYMFDCN